MCKSTKKCTNKTMYQCVPIAIESANLLAVYVLLFYWHIGILAYWHITNSLPAIFLGHRAFYLIGDNNRGTDFHLFFRY